MEEATLGSTTGLSVEQDDTQDVIFSNINHKQLAWQDIRAGLLQWRIWLMLAYQDIKLRYHRSVLGPLWITLSMAITVYSMGYLYSHLFHMVLSEYFPYLVAGMLSWTLISTTVTDMVEALSSNESMLKQIKLPYSLYVHRVATRNIIIFFHNLLVFIPIAIIYHKNIHIGFNWLLVIPGLFVIYLNAILYGVVFAMIGARYRDISQLIKSLIQVVFFLTPVMWSPKILPAKMQFIVNLNPAFSLIELIRAPLLGDSFSITSTCMVLFTTVLGFAAFYYVFTSRRARIIYWL